MNVESDLLSKLGQMQLVSDKLQEILGFSPVALLFVIIIVSVFGKPIAKALKLKENAKSLFLIVLSILISLIAVMATSGTETLAAIAFKTIVFSSLASFSYDILKPVVTALVSFLYKRIERYTGIKIEEEDIITIEEIGDDRAEEDKRIT